MNRCTLAILTLACLRQYRFEHQFALTLTTRLAYASGKSTILVAAIFAVLSVQCCSLQAVQPPVEDSPTESATAEKPALIQMLLPGFNVHELPVELTNVNNVRFREDGKLIALGYNGDVHVLSDSDGDGLEDQVALFWKNEGSLRGPIGMLLTPAGYHLGRGLFTPSKGKLSLIVDTDGDDRADQEIVVAEGWEEIAPQVDATGVAMSPDGWLIFGLGTADYSNAYQVDDKGVSHYSLSSDRGSVQRVSPDFKTRETVCTGIRFPIAFAYNQLGDLFCTEQEGATWLANGNPFDELLHIQAGRHYGFPPRHPRHNPTVNDEPSTFDFAPQHQSTCGMVFNEGVNGGPVFGPTTWVNDALICGESRGKIWRTTLVPSEHGYVADAQLLACLQMLTVDACVAPDGDLVVACHSGPPDWGTGPTGIGKLFRIEMTQPDIPRPVRTWAAGERELCIAWDHPLDPTQLRELAQRIHIEYGQYVRSGDRFETLVPPYAAVEQQLAAPRQPLEVTGVSVSSDLRTLFIATGPLTADQHYAITLESLIAPSIKSKEPQTSTSTQLNSPPHTTSPLPPTPVIDIDLSLTGVTADWQPADGSGSWSGWLPHIDWSVANRLTRDSSLHDSLRQRLLTGGRLTLTTNLDISHILRPQLQPGTSLDYELPQENVTVLFRSKYPFSIDRPDGEIVPAQADGDQYQQRWTVSGGADDSPLLTGSSTAESRETIPGSRTGLDSESRATMGRLPLSVHIDLPAGASPDWALSVSTDQDERQRPLPLRRFKLPWAAEQQVTVQPIATAEIAELAGGDWGRGRRLFHSAAAACFQCHAIQGVGSQDWTRSWQSTSARLPLGAARYPISQPCHQS